MSEARSRVELMHGFNLDMLGAAIIALRHDHPRRAGAQVAGFARDLGLELRCSRRTQRHNSSSTSHHLPGSAMACCSTRAWTHYSWAIHDALEIAAIRPSKWQSIQRRGAR